MNAITSLFRGDGLYEVTRQNRLLKDCDRSPYLTLDQMNFVVAAAQEKYSSEARKAGGRKVVSDLGGHVLDTMRKLVDEAQDRFYPVIAASGYEETPALSLARTYTEADAKINRSGTRFHGWCPPASHLTSRFILEKSMVDGYAQLLQCRGQLR